MGAVLGLLLLAAGQAHGGDLYVNSADEYRISMVAHRARLLSLSLHFKDPLFVEFMRLHDEAKVNDTPKFRALHKIPPNERSIAARLYDLYHLDVYTLPETDPRKHLLREMIAETNRIDDEVGMEFFRSHPGFIEIVDGKEKLTKRALKYQLWQHVIDVVDTRMDPVRRQELKMPPLPERSVEDYFSRMPPEQKDLSKEILKVYKTSTSGLSYFHFLNRARCMAGAIRTQLSLSFH
jgi:hypothetical protein